MLDWLIIGGGIHGTHLSLVLTRRCGVAGERLRVLDPDAQPLARWRACTARTGMRHLRSPAVHHLDLDPSSLRRFANGPGRRWRSFATPYDRPGLELFDRHCDHVVSTHGLDELRVRGRAQRIQLADDHVSVETDRGVLAARNLLVSVGAGEQPSYPSWARTLHAEAPTRIQHVFDLDGGEPGELGADDVLVVGGGISAVQLALRLARRPRGSTTLALRHPLRVHQFDSDPGWLGPRFLDGFAAERRLERRRRLIDEARHRGSVPPDVERALRRAVRRERLRLVSGAIHRVEHDGGALFVELDRTILRCDRIVLATGFERQRPGGDLIDRLVQESGLACADCGYPIVDAALRWHPRLRVSGPLAELELGPAARNIAGARMAGARLAAGA